MHGTTMNQPVAALCATIMTLAMASGPARADDMSAHCAVGAYRLDTGLTIDIAPSEPGLRWRAVDGRSGHLPDAGAGDAAQGGTWDSQLGWTGRPHDLQVAVDCAAGTLVFGGEPGRRIPLEVQETRFEGRDGLPLAGRLLLPPGDGPVPIVVLVHGAERSSARVWDFMQRQLPAEGVGAFVYDKRGTGGSDGTYTQDFDVLADDAVAAVAEARRLAGARAGRTGFRGGSQGGWVAPIAATRTDVAFVIAAYGLAVSVVEEDREATILQMTLKGHPPEVIAQALEIVEAAAVVAASDFQDGIEAFDAVRMKYRDAPWYADVYGNYTHLLLPHFGDDLREVTQAYRFGTPWHYDPRPTLRAVPVPQLWQLAEADLDAPMGETRRRLRVLQADGAPITIATFAGAEHGMTLFETGPGGERISTGYPAGYTRMTVDYAQGTLREAYDGAELEPAIAATPAIRVNRP